MWSRGNGEGLPREAPVTMIVFDIGSFGECEGRSEGGGGGGGKLSREAPRGSRGSAGLNNLRVGLQSTAGIDSTTKYIV
jgi:hypothetical protein